MVLNAIQKSKYFSKEADIVLLCLTHEHGYGNWNEIKHAIRRDSRVKFDHLLMSRSEVELQRRVDILVKTIEKEIEQEKNQVKKQTPQQLQVDIEMISDQSDYQQQSEEDEPMGATNQEDNQSDEDAQIRVGPGV